MRYTDFVFQTILFGIALLLILFSTLFKGLFMWVMLIQLILGPWQLGSSVYGVSLKKKALKQKQIHLALAFTYLVGLFIGMYLRIAETWEVVPILLSVVVLPWMLAIYYYIITWRNTFPATTSGTKFLPHVSF